MAEKNPIVELHEARQEIAEEMMIQILVLSSVPLASRRKIPRELLGRAFSEMKQRGWVRVGKLWTDPQTGRDHSTREAISIEAARISRG